MAGQTSFSQTPTVALPGMLDETLAPVALSRVLEDAAGIEAGRVVQSGTTIGTQFKALTATGQKALGITVLELSREPRTPRFAQKDDVGLLQNGIIWMECVDDMRALDEGSPVYVCFSGANAGLPQAAASGGDLAPYLMCLQGGNTGAVGKFKVNLP